jgi:hypothetical protein
MDLNTSKAKIKFCPICGGELQKLDERLKCVEGHGQFILFTSRFVTIDQTEQVIIYFEATEAVK